MWKSRYSREKIVDKYKLIYIPLIISIVAIMLMSILGYYISKSMLIDQVKNSGIKLADQVSRQVKGNNASLRAMEGALDEKIEISSQIVIAERENLSEEKLLEIQEQLGLDEIHWIRRNGETIYSTHDGYKDWTVPENHPLDIFSKSEERFMVERVRPDAEYGVLTKYGAMKDEDGNYVQIGIRAESIRELTNKFDYQRILTDLEREDSIEYAYILDESFKVLADTDAEAVGTAYSGEKAVLEKQEKSAVSGAVLNEKTLASTGEKIMEIVYPIEFDDGYKEHIVLGISMEEVYRSIEKMLQYSVMVTAVMVGLILWTQNKNIIVPVKNLHDNIHRIDLESDLSYRLPVTEGDTFQGIIHSINAILEESSDYFSELEDSKREISESKEIISSAYQQLSASEEELRAQYDEIQDYTEKLEELKRKYEIAIEGTNSAVWEIDMEDETIYFSKEFSNIVGKRVEKKESLEETIDDIFGESTRKQFMQEYELYKSTGIGELYVQLDYGEDLEKKKLLLQGKGLYKDEMLKSISGIVIDVTKLKEQEEYIEYLAYHDFLTGLPNRRSLMKELDYELGYGKRGALILLDLDNFKEINDTMGHIYGDKILRKIAEKLAELNIENSTISRFGGDEFLVMISEETDIGRISEYADGIIDILKREIAVSGEAEFISCSMGITLYPIDGDDSGQLIMNADMAMYSVKNNGKSNYAFFDKDMVAQVQEKVDIEKQLRDSVENDGFKLLYQPQVDVESGEISGFEALIRLKDRFISPGVFIPIAEETDLIHELGRFVTEEAIRQLQEWKSRGLEGKTVAINFSAKQLKDEGYLEFLKDRLEHYGVAPSELEIEITESVFLEKKDQPLKFLEEVRSMGVRIALDDFGTGYSSLSYLTFLPVNKIKLDKSLSDRFLELENIGVMDSLISLAHSLNLEVIAEGVEYMEQYKKLKVGKCDRIQGYLFSKPLEKEDAELIYNKSFLNEN